jgi:FKBP-type peptidyl-prolyl cis-trans isomerase FklB
MKEVTMNFPRLLSLRSAVLAVSLTAMHAQAAESTVDLSSEASKMSYSIGVNIGQNLADQGIMDSISLDAFYAGIGDVVTGEPRMSMEEMMASLQSFQERLMAQQEAEMAAIRAESEAFLTANATREGVMATDSGLQYLVLESGPTGGVSPTTSDSVLAHYHGTFIDGSVFDSSVDRGEPAEFGVGQVIAGWTEALQMMKVGDKWRLFIPSDLAYGETGSGPIPPFSTLIFDVELLNVITP